MKNFVTVIALMVSTAGIFVSLTREELRCRLGLSTETCQSLSEKSKESPKNSRLTNPDFTKPLSEFSTDKSDSKKKDSEETQTEKPSFSTIPSQNLDKTLEATQELNGSSALKPEGENLNKSTIPSAEAINSNENNASSHSLPTEPISPVNESIQTTIDNSSAKVNESKPDNISPNQSIPVIPPPQTSQP